ncbi:uncharacterized protein LOC131063485 [Cryptomeria japonica]|uniref:uncharacterized protein LOC131063485 n=1 Tax=Cryptomeria japonica TaxID=3369 RepID=UPI0027D9DCE2|nr:uncharacterized protein LOC131063485 [Cryptomeria japonica]
MDSWYRARCPFLQGVNLPFGVPYLRRNVVPGSDASNASEVIRITNHVRRNVAAVMMMRRRRRRNEAELHITSTRKYNSIDDKEDDEEIAKQLAKAIKVCLSKVPNKQRAATSVNVWIWFKQSMWQKQLAFADYYNDKYLCYVCRMSAK